MNEWMNGAYKQTTNNNKKATFAIMEMAFPLKKLVNELEFETLQWLVKLI